MSEDTPTASPDQPKLDPVTISPPRPTHSSITVVEQVYHRQQGGEPTAVGNKWTRHLKSDEQCYIRHSKLDKEWKPVDLGWLTGDDCEIGLLILKNSGRDPIEWGIAGREVIGYGLDEISRVGFILPGESIRFHPAEPKLLRVRAMTTLGPKDPPNFSVYVFPV